MTIDPMALPHAARWRDSYGGTPGLWAYLGEEGGPTLAVAFARLFWPELIEVRGCVLLAEHYEPDNFEQWWERTGGDATQIERALNHLHLWDVFDPAKEDVPEEALTYLAEVLSACWKAALAARFPERSFDVSVSAGDEEYGPTVAFSRRGG